MSKVLCGKPGRRGSCGVTLRDGKCLTHDSDLVARNRRVLANRVKNNPEAWRAHQARAASVCGKRTWRSAAEGARRWRIKHPSRPERAVGDFLLEQLPMDVHYDREHVVNGDPRAIDFAFPDLRVGIEVNRHGASTKEKLAWLASLGWTMHVVRATPDADSNVERTRLLAFLQERGLT